LEATKEVAMEKGMAVHKIFRVDLSLFCLSDSPDFSIFLYKNSLINHAAIER
jgi:hypothetical protein